MEIRTKTALVTGAGGLIGAGIVDHLLAKGWRMAALDVDGLESLAAPAGGDLRRIEADVAEEDGVIRAAAEMADWGGDLDLLVNCAGLAGASSGPVEALDRADWDRRLAVNLTGPFLMVKHLAPALRAAGGAVVNITSTRGRMSEPDCESYAASKGGLMALTHALAISLGPQVRVNAIAPGWIAAPDADLTDTDHAQHPAGRVGTPRDVAEAVEWIAGAAFLTGQEIALDGGMTRKMIYED